MKTMSTFLHEAAQSKGYSDFDYMLDLDIREEILFAILYASDKYAKQMCEEQRKNDAFYSGDNFIGLRILKSPLATDNI